PTACAAVGAYQNAVGVGVTLAEVWDGVSWTVQPTPNPAGATSSELIDVTCVSSSQCIAVGDYFNAAGVDVALVETWNGASWTIQPTPNPAGATATLLRRVSCTTATACTAVGNSVDGSGNLTLAERWNGSSLSIQSTPNPPGGGLLTGVS